MRTDLPLPGRREGKVRDLYDIRTRDGRDALLIVATDRISAFDAVMANGVAGKGEILTRISAFWFDMIGGAWNNAVPGLSHHLISTDPADIEGLGDAEAASLRGRVMIGRRCRVVPIECVVRGYLAGSGWGEYCERGTVCGIALRRGLRQCDKLPEPIFTPATKAAAGHDQNISFERAAEMVGEARMQTLRERSLALYRLAHGYARERGILIADTKFEFGIPEDAPAAEPVLIDEVLTPDSSRFWPADRYEPGGDQPSFDKQYVRNHLQTLVDEGRWDKRPPGPTLPGPVVRNTQAKYLEAYRRLTGAELVPARAGG